MKSILLFLTIILFYNSPLFSQWGNYESALGASAVLSIPTGDFSDYAGTGYGIKAKYIWMFSENVGWQSEAGYITWSEKNHISFNSFLLNTGLKVNFIPDEVGPYFFATFGMHFLSYEVNYSFMESSYSSSASDENFNISSGFGYEFEIDDNIYLDLNVNYNYITKNLENSDIKTSYFGINAGVNFGLF
ncbi:MAG: outer membrane beta-barrel protein [Ignavibacteriae bacterium]|nr:outer membrane beta-barrel protein [Ignavibacteriota bacterium]